MSEEASAQGLPLERLLEHLAAQPDSPERQVAVANALSAVGRPLDAIGHYQKAVSLVPAQTEWQCNLAFLLAEVGRHSEAVELTHRVLKSDPDCFPALYNQAVSLQQMGAAAEAADCLTRCIRLRPADARVHNNLGLALCARGELAAAVAAYDRAIELRPDYARALNNRGLAEIRRHAYARALTDLDAALTLDPAYVAALVNRGLALTGLGKKTGALECYQKAFPSPQALANASAILRDMSRGGEARECAALLYRNAPHMDEAAGIYHSMSQNVAAWSDYQARLDVIVDAIRAGRRAAHPFALLSVTDSPGDQLICARTLARTVSGGAPLWGGERYSHDRIRVAYLSSDLHDHATAFLAIGLFERHDRKRFHIHALSYSDAPTSGPMRRRLRDSFECFEDVHALSSRQIAERVRELEIDVLVDLKGYTDGSRIDVLAHRPAPIQVHYLGYPGTLGAPFVDYLIADRHVIPPQDRQYYDERIVYLPHCYQVTDDRRQADPEVWSRERAGLPGSGPILCAFHQVYKINPPLFDAWMRLLHRLPDATLWLLSDDPTAKEALLREAAARGIRAERLVFAPRLPQDAHVARHALADVFLDAWPVGAHTSASDALWMGVPVVALEGRGFAARVSASVVRAAGLGELVAVSLPDYEEMVYRLCADRERLRRMREGLPYTVRCSALFDTLGFARALEAAYAEMWAIHQSGGEPRPIEIPPG